jgi:hypothetical protein
VKEFTKGKEKRGKKRKRRREGEINELKTRLFSLLSPFFFVLHPHPRPFRKIKQNKQTREREKKIVNSFLPCLTFLAPKPDLCTLFDGQVKWSE